MVSVSGRVCGLTLCHCEVDGEAILFCIRTKPIAHGLRASRRMPARRRRRRRGRQCHLENVEKERSGIKYLPAENESWSPTFNR